MRAWATASLVVGTTSLVLAFIPYLGLLTVVTGPGAVLLGVVALMFGAWRKGSGRGRAITGVVTGAVAFPIVLLIFGVLGGYQRSRVSDAWSV